MKEYSYISTPPLGLRGLFEGKFTIILDKLSEDSLSGQIFATVNVTGFVY